MLFYIPRIGYHKIACRFITPQCHCHSNYVHNAEVGEIGYKRGHLEYLTPSATVVNKGKMMQKLVFTLLVMHLINGSASTRWRGLPFHHRLMQLKDEMIRTTLAGKYEVAASSDSYSETCIKDHLHADQTT